MCSTRSVTDNTPFRQSPPSPERAEPQTGEHTHTHTHTQTQTQHTTHTRQRLTDSYSHTRTHTHSHTHTHIVTPSLCGISSDKAFVNVFAQEPMQKGPLTQKGPQPVASFTKEAPDAKHTSLNVTHSNTLPAGLLGG